VPVAIAAFLRTSAGVANATATSRTNHGPSSLPDAETANRVRMISQVKASDLVVYSIPIHSFPAARP
jgi:hypothetical protein